jgi:DNA-binding transcriptional LysR family regulator
MMDIHKLRVFCAVVETGSFSRAAMKVRLKQPVVSAHVRTLEHSVGLPLIDRTKRPVMPTNAGRLIYESANKIFEGINDFELVVSDLKKKQRGEAYVSTTSMLGNVILPEIVLRFRSAYPDINIHVNVGNPEKVFSQVLTGVSHFGVLISEKPSQLFSAVSGGPIELVVVHKVDSISKLGKPSLCELFKERGIVAPHRNIQFLRVLEKLLKRYGIKDLPVRYEVGSWEAAKRTVMQGIGVTILPRQWVVRELETHQLDEFRIGSNSLAAPVYIVRRAKGSVTAPVKRFQNFLITALSNLSRTPNEAAARTPTRVKASIIAVNREAN